MTKGKIAKRALKAIACASIAQLSWENRAPAARRMAITLNDADGSRRGTDDPHRRVDDRDRTRAAQRRDSLRREPCVSGMHLRPACAGRPRLGRPGTIRSRE